MAERPKESSITSEQVISMSLADFERIFGFRPADRQEKHWFAATGKRLDPTSRAAIEAGLVGTVNVDHVRFD
jgi:hypothetical protein